jgi:predicted nucleic acid-binding protein
MAFTCVLDASAFILAVTGDSEIAEGLLERLARAEVHAPHLIDAEVASVLRRLLLAGKLSEEVAATGLVTLPGLIDERYPHFGWVARAGWELRGAITFYDAVYVALAARLDVPLITADAKLGRAPGLPCKVEVVG